MRHRIRNEFDVETVIHGDNGASYVRLSHQVCFFPFYHGLISYYNCSNFITPYNLTATRLLAFRS